MTLPLALVVCAGCGDPVLPSDYAGPPAAAVSGDVISGLPQSVRDAERPRMSLEWLPDKRATTSLIGQPLAFRRSIKLQHDWDIGLWLPSEGAKFSVEVDAGGGASYRIGVGKIVYFDDRNKLERIDWECRGQACNRVLAISTQFVLYVEQPSYCQEPGKATSRPRIAAGYHYVSFDTTTRAMRELSPSDPMSFTAVDKAPADSVPTNQLIEFADQLWRDWHFGNLAGCE
jgi:hypothetical protein